MSWLSQHPYEEIEEPQCNEGPWAHPEIEHFIISSDPPERHYILWETSILLIAYNFSMSLAWGQAFQQRGVCSTTVLINWTDNNYTHIT